MTLTTASEEETGLRFIDEMVLCLQGVLDYNLSSEDLINEKVGIIHQLEAISRGLTK